MSRAFDAYTTAELRRGMELAVEEGTRVGRGALRDKYGFGPATKYVAVVAGHHFDSKALVAAAAAHLDPAESLTSENTWGGAPTTTVLDQCGIPWIDTDSLADIPGLEITSNPPLTDSGRPKYWWVNQSENYEMVIADGSLWAPHLRSDGRPGHADWQALHFMKPGDMVFHYAGKGFRALSRVASGGVESKRPHGYTGDLDGTVVLVEPIVIDMEIGIEKLRPIFPPVVGPMNRSGEVGRVYVSPVPATLGGPLARYLSGGSGEPGDSKIDYQESGAETLRIASTDLVRTAKARAEQQFLRAQLLADYGPQCAICSRVLPQNLLVAAHIKRRAECTDAERLDFATAAMITCTLGCDTLFEFGYVTVDEAGFVRATPTAVPGLSSELASRDGLQCLAFSDTTAVNFDHHRRVHSSRIAGSS